MEWVLIILGIILCLVGVAGSLLPVMPGPPVAFIGLLLQQLRDPNPFDTSFLLIWAGIVVIALVLDFYIPLWGVKKYGGTSLGKWGATLGFLAAFWLGPWGIILGPFAGAFVGELLANQKSKNAFRAAMGSFIGFLIGSLLKVVICFFLLYYVIESI